MAGMAALLAATVVLRLEGIGTWYWVDEALSVGIARHPIAEIPHLLLRDGSPPLWYLLLHLWTSVLGTSAVATHAMSVVFGIAVVPVAWVVARRVFDERAAWCTGALVAVSPFVTYFGHETRMYSLVVVLAVLVCWSFVAAFVDGSDRARWWFAVA
ncbi:MAG: mannosyltransferase, partial [Actinomycetota bacterium]|nr:mannosyltransferase [Actinomycetota bacterium]